MTGEFPCFYCGEAKPATEASDEHIIPSCIGGNRNATLTTQVCKDCNAFAGREIDAPFARDWFISAARVVAGVKHRRKHPSLAAGAITWDRPERLELQLLERGVSIVVIDGVDGFVDSP